MLAPIELVRWFVASCAWLGRSRASRGAEPTGTHEEAADELRATMAALAPLDSSGPTNETSALWSRRRRELRRMILAHDPGSFLTWNPIVRTMTFGLNSWIPAEFQALRDSEEWHTRWHDALGENRGGLPMPRFLNPFTSATLVHHAYHLHRFEQATGRTIADFGEITEFGGGYGSMARLAVRLGFRGRYHLHDLPEFCALQRFYLRTVRSEIGPGAAAEALSRVTLSSHQEDALPTREGGDEALFLATWSLAETPIGLREEWRPALARFSCFLFGFKDRFEGIDNRGWFQDLVSSRPDVEWRLEPIPHRGEQLHYLFGAPADGERRVAEP